VEGQHHAPTASTPGKHPVPFVQEAERAPGPVWTGGKSRPPPDFRSPDRPARSESLYRLSYDFCVSSSRFSQGITFFETSEVLA